VSAVILASSSPTRAKLLQNAGVSFESVAPHVDEDAVKQSLRGARIIADALAELKAVRVSQSHPGVLVIGSDLVLDFEGKIVSKSETLADARALLAKLRGRKHQLVCAVVLARAGRPIWRHVETASLWMNDFSDAFLDAYLESEGETLLGGVGCYRIEARGIQLFARIEGDYFSILGLPLVPLLRALREQGALPK
jgi:nucleoside triphosphate pyrophosphatase